MNSKNPMRKDGIQSQQVGNEWMLHDSAKGTVHVINSTAEFVWRLCDGSNNIDKIKQEVMKVYDISDDGDLKTDIDKILKKFYELEVLQD